MNSWKLTIKPNEEKGYDAFDLCKSKSLLGVGWSGAYDVAQPESLIDARRLVEARYKK